MHAKLRRKAPWFFNLISFDMLMLDVCVILDASCCSGLCGNINSQFFLFCYHIHLLVLDLDLDLVIYI